MIKYFSLRSRTLSFFCAGLVGFSFGVGATFIGVAAFILAIILDFISKVCSNKIEQNKNSDTNLS